MIIFSFYTFFGVGVLFFIVPIIILIVMFIKRKFSVWTSIKCAIAIILAIIIFWITLPSLTYIVNKDFEVVRGECTIDIKITKGTRGGDDSDITFHMLDTDDRFFFTVIPELDDHEKSKHYYCEVTVTKDHMWEIGYEIYELDSRELLTEYRDE